MRPEQKMPIIPFPQTHDRDPDGGPLWMRWLRGAAAVLDDFEKYMNHEIERVQKDYEPRIAKGLEVQSLAGYERALRNLLQQVKLYEVEEKQNVAFQEKRRGTT